MMRRALLMSHKTYETMLTIVSGATGAIGKEICRGLAAKGHDIILACRNTEKAGQVAREITREYRVKTHVVALDLADADSVRRAAAAIIPLHPGILINNAGVMAEKFRTDPGGHEHTLTVNYYNTRLLTELLLPHIPQGGAIVFTTSHTRRWYPFQKLDEEISPANFTRLRAYALSKKLITRYARQLAKTDIGIRINCADPTVVDTPILRMDRWYDRLTDRLFRPLCLSPRHGARAAIRAATSPRTSRIFYPLLSLPL